MQRKELGGVFERLFERLERVDQAGGVQLGQPGSRAAESGLAAEVRHIGHADDAPMASTACAVSAWTSASPCIRSVLISRAISPSCGSVARSAVDRRSAVRGRHGVPEQEDWESSCRRDVRRAQAPRGPPSHVRIKGRGLRCYSEPQGAAHWEPGVWAADHAEW